MDTAIATARQAVIVTDAHGNITHWNGFSEELYGWTAREAVGRHLADLLCAPAVVEIGRGIIGEILSGATWAGPFTLARKDGREFDVFAVAAPTVENGRITGLLSTSAAVEETANDARVIASLTDREREVLALSATARNNADIAAELAISRRTVESHQASIYQKLGIASRLELIVFAIRHGIVNTTDLTGDDDHSA